MKAFVFNPYWDTLGGGERYIASVAKLLLEKKYQVWIYGEESLIAGVKNKFDIDLSAASVTKDISRFGYDLVFWLSDGSLPTILAKKTLIHFQFPFKVNHLPIQDKLKGKIYTFICNSKFTKSFIDSSYSVNSQVVYPPVDTKRFASCAEKKNQIIYVGRFSNLTQSKNHHLLIDAFKIFYKKYPNWKLVLAGGLGVGADQDYMDKLKVSATKLPISIVTNPSLVELKDLYSQSKIYWSASGFGVDENTHPTQVEHFGITVVESMAARCVPIICNVGGHKEIVQSGFNGYLWDTFNELVSLTESLIESKDNLIKMSAVACESSKIFDITNFNAQVSNFL